MPNTTSVAAAASGRALRPPRGPNVFAASLAAPGIAIHLLVIVALVLLCIPLLPLALLLAIGINASTPFGASTAVDRE